MRQEFEQEYFQLGLKIAYYRKLRGLTQEELAERIDRSAAFVGHVEAPNIKKAISIHPNRKRSRKPHRICHCTRFIRWIMEQVKEHKWSLDACA